MWMNQRENRKLPHLNILRQDSAFKVDDGYPSARVVSRHEITYVCRPFSLTFCGDWPGLHVHLNPQPAEIESMHIPIPLNSGYHAHVNMFRLTTPILELKSAAWDRAGGSGTCNFQPGGMGL